MFLTWHYFVSFCRVSCPHIHAHSITIILFSRPFRSHNIANTQTKHYITKASSTTPLSSSVTLRDRNSDVRQRNDSKRLITREPKWSQDLTRQLGLLHSWQTHRPMTTIQHFNWLSLVNTGLCKCLSDRERKSIMLCRPEYSTNSVVLAQSVDIAVSVNGAH